MLLKICSKKVFLIIVLSKIGSFPNKEITNLVLRALIFMDLLLIASKNEMRLVQDFVPVSYLTTTTKKVLVIASIFYLTGNCTKAKCNFDHVPLCKLAPSGRCFGCDNLNIHVPSSFLHKNNNQAANKSQVHKLGQSQLSPVKDSTLESPCFRQHYGSHSSLIKYSSLPPSLSDTKHHAQGIHPPKRPFDPEMYSIQITIADFTQPKLSHNSLLLIFLPDIDPFAYQICSMHPRCC